MHTIHQHDTPICDFTAERILAEKGLPAAQFDGTFARSVIRSLQNAIRDSTGRVRPVTEVGFGKAKVRRIASNRTVRLKDGSYATRYSKEKRPAYRRMGKGLIDPELSLVSFWDGDTPLAALSFYATHPQSYYLTQTANPDFPGIARALRDLKVPDVLHIHFNGAGGNIAAGKYNDGSHRMRLVLARRLERAMAKAWRRTEKAGICDLRWETEPLLLPASVETATLENRLDSLSHNELSNNLGKLGWYRRRQAGIPVQAACLAINREIRLLFLPGELFVEYQLAAKRMCPDKSVALAAYGDYGPFYIGTREAYDIGGYEIRSSPVTPEVEGYLLDRIRTLLDRADRQVIVAHRGGALIGNENTLSCFEKGIQAGADMIELDAHLTRDGEVVVCHDPDLKRTTDTQGAIEEMDLAQFKAARALDRESGDVTGEALPTLAEVFELVDGRCGILLEIKKFHKGQYEGIEQKCLDLIEQYGLHDKVVMQSFDDSVVETIHALDPTMRVEKLIVCRLPFGLCFDSGIHRFSFKKYDYCTGINPMGRLTSRRFIRKAHAAGKTVRVWTVNDPKAAKPAADAIITNRPDLFIRR